VSRPVAGARFVLTSSGFADGPAQALRDHLLAGGADVAMVEHPLTAEGPAEHRLLTVRGGTRSVRRVRLPNRPPVTYALDPLVPPLLPRADAVIGFNPLMGAQAVAHRALGRCAQAATWYVDFSGDRFDDSPLTRVYDALDRVCCRRSDARFELSGAARDARDARLGLGPADRARAHVVPMGAWLTRVPTSGPDGWEARRLVYLGHLVERQGVELVVDALALLRERGVEASADVIGDGPLRGALEVRAAERGLSADAIRFRGFVEDHRDVEAILAGASIALAPYREDPGSFTRFADPGKLKAYLGAGLPVLLTPVPPNAEELAREAGAEVLPHDAEAFAAAAARLLETPAHWRARRDAALGYARGFDWAAILPAALGHLGFHA
jgi:glycosyltransferase involved in cell wall biosynthesis